MTPEQKILSAMGVDLDTLRDQLDGEAEILNDKGDYCFDHTIFLEGECMECGLPLKPDN